MENLVIIVILVGLVGTAVIYIHKEKKKGTRCIGCPAAGCCSAKGCENTNDTCKSHTDRN